MLVGRPRGAVAGGVFHGRYPGAQKIRVEAGNNIGFREQIVR